MLEVINLCSGYPGRDVLRDFSMTAAPGQITAIVGPNGCGKTTLLKSLCGILQPKNGSVLLDDEDILALPPRLLAQKMAYLSQGRQVPELTAFRLVLHGRFPYLHYPRRYGKEDLAIAREAMEQLNIWDLADTPLSRLSGGQRQKVYIAMALAQQTPVILLDEPTTYLDISHQLQTLALARSLADRGKTVLMVIHDLPHALQMADQVILMAHGIVAGKGSPEELFRDGQIEKIFGIRLGRFQTDSGLQYYCQEGNL